MVSLTEEQKQEMAVIIDTWYLEWKHKITDNGIPHRFGFAKEQLKQRLEE